MDVDVNVDGTENETTGNEMNCCEVIRYEYEYE